MHVSASPPTIRGDAHSPHHGRAEGRSSGHLMQAMVITD